MSKWNHVIEGLNVKDLKSHFCFSVESRNEGKEVVIFSYIISLKKNWMLIFNSIA